MGTVGSHMPSLTVVIPPSVESTTRKIRFLSWSYVVPIQMIFV